MMKKAYLLLAVLVALLLVVSGCTKPVDLTEAEQAVQEAKAAGAPTNCPDKYGAAEAMLATAQQANADKDYKKAEVDKNETIVLAAVAKGCPPPPPVPPPPPPPPPKADKLNLGAVNFDLDRYNIRTDATHILKMHSKKIDADKKLLLEGHCDERGTAEYNMALGERRAKSVKNYLVSLGVNGKNLKTLSFGENKPVAMGSNEAAWAKNRRVEFKDMN
jgi:peptidoglycan-associated lipoprotein